MSVASLAIGPPRPAQRDIAFPFVMSLVRGVFARFFCFFPLGRSDLFPYRQGHHEQMKGLSVSENCEVLKSH